MAIGVAARVEEGVVRKAVQERSLLHHLEDGVLNWRGVCTGERVQVDSDDGDTVRELLDVLASGVQRVEVVEVGQRAEELACSAHLVADNEATLPAAFNFEDLERAISICALDEY